MKKDEGMTKSTKLDIYNNPLLNKGIDVLNNNIFGQYFIAY